MAENKTKRKAGIILFSIGIVILVVREFFPFIFYNLMVFNIISIICLLIGAIFLYIGLSIKNRAIMLFIVGGYFIYLTMSIIIRINLYLIMLVTLLIVNLVLWVLVFIIPGIIKLIKKINFSERTTYLYALAPLTVFLLLIYTIVITVMTVNAPQTFVTTYFQYFFIALGGGVILSIIILVIVYESPTL
ncbi:MAG: hypothetical protein ACFFG0_56390 [Candidatus Thorarchaeota archaeon]